MHRPTQCRSCGIDLTEVEARGLVPMECTACGLARYRRMEAECTQSGSSARLRRLLSMHREPVRAAIGRCIAAATI